MIKCLNKIVVEVESSFKAQGLEALQELESTFTSTKHFRKGLEQEQELEALSLEALSPKHFGKVIQLQSPNYKHKKVLKVQGLKVLKGLEALLQAQSPQALPSSGLGDVQLYKLGYIL